MDDWETHNDSGLSLYRQGQYAEAYQAFSSAWESSPDKAVLLYNLGMTALALNRHVEAMDLLHRYEDLNRQTCPYFGKPGRDDVEEINLYRLSQDDFDVYLSQGWRRTGQTISRNRCLSCRLCVQMRVNLGDYRPSASQRRVLARNSDLRFVWSPLRPPDEDRVSLYRRYQARRHGWLHFDALEDLNRTYAGWQYSIELSVYLGESLVAVFLMDRGIRNLYAALCYFDPELPRRSLGIFCLTRALIDGLGLGFEYLYTGEYLEEKPNMRYKRSFLPREDLVDGQWQRVERHSRG